MFQHDLSIGSGLYTLCVSNQEGPPQFVLQGTDRFADIRLGHIHTGRRL